MFNNKPVNERSQVISARSFISVATLAVMTGTAAAATSGCGAPDPGKTFLENFLNSCYQLNLLPGTGGGALAGDLNEKYFGIYYRVDPRYELVVIGAYPQARYMSLSSYDDHRATVGWLHDSEIVPLPGYQDPYIVGAQFEANQLYAVTVQMGGTQPSQGQILPGCDLGGVDIHANVFDGTKRHEGISWNGEPNLPAWLPVHDDIGPSKAGEIVEREDLSQTIVGAQYPNPTILVRDLSTGCAVPAQQVLWTQGQSETPDMILALNQNLGTTWMSAPQVQGHLWYAHTYQTRMCYRKDPESHITFFAGAEYDPLVSPDTGYLIGQVSSSDLSWLLSNGGFMRLRVRLPTLPAIPCLNGCSLTGLEELRYWSFSFMIAPTTVLASISDKDVVTDANGYATIIVGFGANPPSWVTSANGYTYFNLAAVPNFKQMNTVHLRTVLPIPGFLCTAENVPFHTTEYNPLGGYIGEYVTAMDTIDGSAIPTMPTPLQRTDSCGLVPTQPPQQCQP